MFTGIIETTGLIESITAEGENISFVINSPVSSELKPDQSVSHDGVCLTVESVINNKHTVTAIAETLNKTNLSLKKAGDRLNIERCMMASSRIDGHFVQGHVDATAKCLNKENKNGSTEFEFSIPEGFEMLIVEKGSVAINGISLTCFNVIKNSFKVAIIPYTMEHTNIGEINPGSVVNLEFDILGKYIQRYIQLNISSEINK